MTTVFADTSVLVRAYLPDEPDHARWRALLADGRQAVVASALARVEFASAVHAAERAGRLPSRHPLLARFDADSGRDGPLALVAFDPAVLGLAYELVRDHSVRTLDALHLAVLLELVAPVVDDVALATCDDVQRATAAALGVKLLP